MFIGSFILWKKKDETNLDDVKGWKIAYNSHWHQWKQYKTQSLELGVQTSKVGNAKSMRKLKATQKDVTATKAVWGRIREKLVSVTPIHKNSILKIK